MKLISGYTSDHDIWITIGIAVSGLIIGWLLEKLILKRLLQTMVTAGWHGEIFLRKAVRGFFIFGLFIAGLYAAAHYGFQPEAWEDQLDLGVKILYILFLTVYFSRGFTAVIRFYVEQGDTKLPNSSILINLIRFLVIVIGFIIILNVLGISITPMLTALGVGGLAVALAMQDTLGNLFAGLQILASKKFRIGNIIRLDSGEEGIVEDISWRNTTMRTLRNNWVVIPNSKVSNAILTNFSEPTDEFTVVVDCSVAYNSDLEFVYSVALDEANLLMGMEEYSVEGFIPSVLFLEFATSGISLRVFLRTRNFTSQFSLRHQFIINLHKRFKKESIEIPYSKMDIYIKNSGMEMENVLNIEE